MKPGNTVSNEQPTKAEDLLSSNIKAMEGLHVQAESEASQHERLLERVVVQLGRPRFVYISIGLVTAWVAANSWAERALDKAPFDFLELALTLAAFITTLMVLGRQNRQSHLSEKRNHLQLQVNILTEQKIAKIIDLLEELRRDLPGVRDRDDDLAQAMAQTTDPGSVMSALDRSALNRRDGKNRP